MHAGAGSEPHVLQAAILEGLAPQARAELGAACRWRRWNKNSLIVSQDNEGDEVLFIQTGQIRVTVNPATTLVYR